MKKVKIVCTIGPSSSDFAVMQSLADAGMDVARFNFSHGTWEGHEKNLLSVRRIEKSLGRPIAAMIDTRGPEIRTGKLEEGEVNLTEGQTFFLYGEQVTGNVEGVSINTPSILKELSPEQRIYIDDGLLELLVVESFKDKVKARVVTGGILGNSKGVNFPGIYLTLPAMSDIDYKDICWGIDHGMEYVAVSFVKNHEDILDVRRVIEEKGSTMKIIAKIETRQAVDNIKEIIKVVDGLMVARGDLGVDITAQEVPLVQKKLVRLCMDQGKPVIVATQMLDSMIRNPRPTRAEASDVANAVLDGADALMLSGETANGKYPLESVKMMANIINQVENEVLTREPAAFNPEKIGIPDAISHAAVTVVKQMNIKTVLSLTKSGVTARMVAKHRPPSMIIGSTSAENTWRELSLVWGVIPIREAQPESETAAVDLSILGSISRGIISEGELIAVTAGFPMGIPGTTNMLQLQVAGSILVNGMPYLKKEATGTVIKASTPEEANTRTREGDILVVRGTDKNYMPAIRKCAGLITEQAGLTSHPAIVALEMDLPCVLGAVGAMEILEDGMTVTIDGERGAVYQGNVRLRA